MRVFLKKKELRIKRIDNLLYNNKLAFEVGQQVHDRLFSFALLSNDLVKILLSAQVDIMVR